MKRDRETAVALPHSHRSPPRSPYLPCQILVQRKSSELEQIYGVSYRNQQRGTRCGSSCRFDSRFGKMKTCVCVFNIGTSMYYYRFFYLLYVYIYVSFSFSFLILPFFMILQTGPSTASQPTYVPKTIIIHCGPNLDAHPAAR